ncbi:MAG: 1-(5-phosphoribosyl)-5-[(5-phosphoribosylamino)methylideneamino]imidazole-4-carboxamide isomerase [bacterium]
MELIPAIDLKEGKCVRLRQGRMEDSTVFADDPVEMADRWVEAGCSRLHLVDLDGAFAGEPKNHEAIRRIIAAHPDLTVQVGGGIRSEQTVESYLNDGVQYAIIGTRAVAEPHFINDLCLNFPGHVIVGLDAKDGKVAIDGWSKLSHHDVIDIAKHFETDGVAGIIYTDISKDGMMQGVSVDSTVALAQAVRVPVIASGGVTSMKDIEALCAVEDEGISGVIIGRALYEGGIDLAEAEKYVSEYKRV